MAAKKPSLENYTKNQQEFLTCLPSRLIEIALNDLIKCEKSPKYRIDMYDWIATRIDCKTNKSVCFVCLAGACVSQTFDITSYMIPDENYLKQTVINGFAKEVAIRMHALDCFRLGYVQEGFEYMKIQNKLLGQDLDRKYKTINDSKYAIPLYKDPEFDKTLNRRFKTRLRSLISELRAYGL